MKHAEEQDQMLELHPGSADWGRLHFPLMACAA